MLISKSIKTNETGFFPHINTGTILDLANGAFAESYDGKMILNGGLSFTNGYQGKPQRFKTGLTISSALGALCRYKDSELFFYDSESSVGTKERILNMCEPGHDLVDLEDRIVLLDHIEYGLNELFDHIKEIYHFKMKNRKELMVETPFVDKKTGKKRKMLLPTIYVIDSITRARLQAEFDKLDKHGVASDKVNMIDMDDGRRKSIFVGNLAKMAIQANIYFIITAHVGTKHELNQFARTTKDLTYMKGTEDTKGTGSQFKFAVNSLVELRDASPLLDNNKVGPKYPMPWSNKNELMESVGITIRGKNNQSGNILKQVLSQDVGIRRGISYFHMLRDNKNAGLIVGGQKNLFSLKWLPDVKPFFDSQARAIIEKDQKISRALELIGQMYYIKNNWSLFKMYDIIGDTDVEKFVDMVHAGGDNFIQDILASRGYWTYDTKDPKPYMSVVDIINLVKNGKIKQKGK